MPRRDPVFVTFEHSRETAQYAPWRMEFDSNPKWLVRGDPWSSFSFFFFEGRKEITVQCVKVFKKKKVGDQFRSGPRDGFPK